MSSDASDVAARQVVAGSVTELVVAFSVSLENQEMRPGGNVVHAWGTPQDWFLELKDGQRLRLLVEIEKSAPIAQPEDNLLNWYDSCETTSCGDQDEHGTMTILGSETSNRLDLEGMEVSDTTFGGDMEPISVSPLAMAPPPWGGAL